MGTDLTKVNKTNDWWSTSSGRYWYHPKSSTLYSIPNQQTMNHTTAVYENPKRFGISAGELTEPTNSNYDGAILLRAMQNGWVRVLINVRNPQRGTSIEGRWFAGLADTVREVRKHTLVNNGDIFLTVVQRRGPEHRNGKIHSFHTTDLLDEFIRTRKIPHGVDINRVS
jgi:hypothetical protein